jgi:hypothetical protein
MKSIDTVTLVKEDDEWKFVPDGSDSWPLAKKFIVIEVKGEHKSEKYVNLKEVDDGKHLYWMPF